jgi:hypothetical protein
VLAPLVVQSQNLRQAAPWGTLSDSIVAHFGPPTIMRGTGRIKAYAYSRIFFLGDSAQVVLRVDSLNGLQGFVAFFPYDTTDSSSASRRLGTIAARIGTAAPLLSHKVAGAGSDAHWSWVFSGGASATASIEPVFGAILVTADAPMPVMATDTTDTLPRKDP